MKTILITGGSGYIGSSVAWYLSHHPYRIIILDRVLPPISLCTTTITQEDNPLEDTLLFMQGDYADQALLNYIFTRYTIDTVIHLAAAIEVHESIQNPAYYYDNNVGKTITLLNTMLIHRVKRCIFSSSCAVFGIPQGPLDEEHPKSPISPYGWTKLMIEQLLKDYAHAYDLQSICFRYFNAAGALPEADLGERHIPETHLIPRFIEAAHIGTPCTVFGTSYPTADGTCLRDYIHIHDLARAHALAVEYLNESVGYVDFNLGTGVGSSILSIAHTIEQQMGHSLNITYDAARAGDPPTLVAKSDKASTLLGFTPQHSTIEHIIKSAILFYAKHSIQRFPRNN